MDNNARVAQVRRDIARLLTVQRAHEIELAESTEAVRAVATQGRRSSDGRERGPGGRLERRARRLRTEERVNRRRVREGTVVENRMDKTAVVAVVERVRHAKYSKTVQRTRRLYVHDENNEAATGDRVRVAETRPFSKLKRWRLVEVVERAR